MRGAIGVEEKFSGKLFSRKRSASGKIGWKIEKKTSRSSKKKNCLKSLPERVVKSTRFVVYIIAMIAILEFSCESEEEKKKVLGKFNATAGV